MSLKYIYFNNDLLIYQLTMKRFLNYKSENITYTDWFLISANINFINEINNKVHNKDNFSS